jgi:hypothetical protein
METPPAALAVGLGRTGGVDTQPRPMVLDGCPCSPQRTPGFPVEFPGVDELHAAFLEESRTRIRWWRLVQEIRDHGPKTDFSNAFTESTKTLTLGPKVLLPGNNSVGRGYAPSFSAHVR